LLDIPSGVGWQRRGRTRLASVLRMMRALAISISVALVGCYHYEFVQRAPAPGESLVTHRERRPTWLNGLVGTGVTDTAQYCAHPVRTELRVEAIDVLVSLATLLIYTPHTLYVTCGTPLASPSTTAVKRS
jgi:Bor protein